MYVTITLPYHALPNGTVCPAAEAELPDVAVSREPDDPNYGADADGNRGVFVAGGFVVDGEIPATCPDCGQVFDSRDVGAMEAEAIAEAEARWDA